MKHHILIYHRNAVQPEVAIRSGESKLGETLHFLEPGETLMDLKSYKKKGGRFVLLGIPESIGVEANFGKCCTENAWPAFLKYFLNIQSNRFLKGNSILCLGHINAQDLNQTSASLDRTLTETIQKKRLLCSRLDDRVYPVIEKIVTAGMIPVVIGGGHNNAYPIIKGTARALGSKGGINCINCDPHADYRALEGRHSGNSFSYAAEEGYLARYFILGLHESYNPEAVLQAIDQNEQAAYKCFEPDTPMREYVKEAVKFLGKTNTPVGIELDLDSIIDMPSSFSTPSGFSVEEARLYIRQITAQLQPAYLHLPEGAPMRGNFEESRVGKILAYLVADFIKSFNP